MSGIGNWFRQLGFKIKMGLMRFMRGRYGTDKLNTVILWTGVLILLATLVLSFFLPENVLTVVNLVLTLLSYACLFVVIFRCFSRNTYKRYRENRKFLFMIEKIKDRDHRYFTCPKCRQSVRVPKGKGKIAISCPKCREKFVKKT